MTNKLIKNNSTIMLRLLLIHILPTSVTVVEPNIKIL